VMDVCFQRRHSPTVVQLPLPFFLLLMPLYSFRHYCYAAILQCASHDNVSKEQSPFVPFLDLILSVYCTVLSYFSIQQASVSLGIVFLSLPSMRVYLTGVVVPFAGVKLHCSMVL
jgi:hypothetical protein